MYPPEERERRLRIVERGVKSEFWTVLSESMETWRAVKAQEVVNLHAEARHEEARELAFMVQAVRVIMADPAKIISRNKPEFDKWYVSICKECKRHIRKLLSPEEARNRAAERDKISELL